MAENFDTAFAAFLQGVERAAGDWQGGPYKIETDIGPRYIRVVRVEPDLNGKDRRTLHCFVDRTNGEVLDGGWKAPRKTKQSKGNIFDANNGLGSMGKYGLAYLR